MTSTYFEGKAESNPKAMRGYSRDHRPDCKQVCIAMVVTFDGFPLGYEVFEGNTHDSKTVHQIVESMEKRHGVIGRVWVMDRGMVSEDNVDWLKETGRRYIIGTPKVQMKKWAAELADKTSWKEIREGIEVKLCADLDGKDEMFILCRSRDRVEKERAMHELFIARISKALCKLESRIARSKKKLNRDSINRQIGRILQLNQRAAARFQIDLIDDDSRASFHLKVSINESFDEWSLISEGAYILRTNIMDWTEERLWKTYIQLTQAEAAFRIQKKELSIRPVWHHSEGRVEAHIFVCFLSFAMWKVLEGWQSKAGLGNSPRTILEEFARIQSHDVVLPTTLGVDVKLRCIAQPDSAQEIILERLGLTLPKRMKLPDIQDLN
jgi:transposase